MSLLMDALKKADEVKESRQEFAHHPQDDDTKDPLFLEKENDLFFVEMDDEISEPPSKFFESGSEPSPINWNEDLLDEFKEIELQKETESLAPSESNQMRESLDQNETLGSDIKENETLGSDLQEDEVKPEKHSDWEDEFLPEFQDDDDDNKSEPLSLNNDHLSDNDPTHWNEEQLFNNFKTIKEEPPETTKTSIPSFKMTPLDEDEEDKPQTAQLKEEQLTSPQIQKQPVSEEKYIPQPEVAQRVLAANAPSDSRRTVWLSGILVLLLLSMGGGYYYYTQSSLSEPSSFHFRPHRSLMTATSMATDSEPIHSDSSQAIYSESLVSQSETVVQQSDNSTLSSPSSIPSSAVTTVKKPTAENIQTDDSHPVEMVKKTTEEKIQTETKNEPHNDSQIASNETVSPANDSEKSSAKGPINFLSFLTQSGSSKPAQSNSTSKVVSQPKVAVAEQLKGTIKTKTAPQPNAAVQEKLASKTFNVSKSSNDKVAKPTSPNAQGIHTLEKQVINKIGAELSIGYKAFQQGNDGIAHRAYQRALQQDKNNRDALLGLAALALRGGNVSQAQQYYQQILQLYPKDTLAQVGLINTLNNGLPENESRLKLLLAQAPQSAYIHFSLGNLYAQQGRWAQAQQAYFEAYRYDNEQADYAYNLAVSLDQLNQYQAALTYYQRALQLLRSQTVSFSPQAVHQRMQTLVNHTKATALGLSRKSF